MPYNKYVKICKKCGISQQVARFDKNYGICGKCRYKARNDLGKRAKYQRDYRATVKQACVDYKGGKCIDCGYFKCLQALEFHHLDPTKKDFAISSKFIADLEVFKPELDKCVLLCSNCHKERHAAQTRLIIGFNTL